MSTDKRIGNLNGPWSVLLRLALATYPLVLGWSVWMTQAQFADQAFRSRSDLFFRADADAMRRDVEAVDAAARVDFERRFEERLRAFEARQVAQIEQLTRVETRLLMLLDRNAPDPGGF